VYDVQVSAVLPEVRGAVNVDATFGDRGATGA